MPTRPVATRAAARTSKAIAVLCLGLGTGLALAADPAPTRGPDAARVAPAHSSNHRKPSPKRQHAPAHAASETQPAPPPERGLAPSPGMRAPRLLPSRTGPGFMDDGARKREGRPGS